MSSRHPSRLSIPVVLGTVGLHLAAVILGGYFLSPEFTLYPFLSSKGFLPYANIIDQHFPLLLFGPFSFPSWLTVNPFPLLLLFLATLAATDLFLFLALLRRKTPHPKFWLLVWVVAAYWFSGNTLWLETFINLFLSLIIFVNGEEGLGSFSRGFLFALIILIKPTFLPALFLFFLFLKLKLKPTFILGFFLPLLITAFFLFRYHLLADFTYLTTTFNKNFYTVYAVKVPNKRQILEFSAILALSFFLFFRRRSFLKIAVILASAVLAYPRFEYVHLQPAIFLLVFLLSDQPIRRYLLFLTVGVLAVFAFAIVKSIRHSYGDFFLDPATQKVAQKLKTMPGTSLYLLGGNDLIYQLSGRVPPDFTYLPSLPWYFKDDSLVKKMITALIYSPGTLVLVKQHSTVDGVNIQNSSGQIGKFIKDNYQAGEMIEDYQVYTRNLK